METVHRTEHPPPPATLFQNNNEKEDTGDEISDI